MIGIITTGVTILLSLLLVTRKVNVLEKIDQVMIMVAFIMFTFYFDFANVDGPNQVLSVFILIGARFAYMSGKKNRGEWILYNTKGNDKQIKNIVRHYKTKANFQGISVKYNFETKEEKRELKQKLEQTLSVRNNKDYLPIGITIMLVIYLVVQLYSMFFL